MIRVKPYIASAIGTDDDERAVLPTIMYAARHAYDKDCIGMGSPTYRTSVKIIVLGWWAWGLGIRIISRRKVNG